jgi:hemerythrin-like domain-containing protein
MTSQQATRGPLPRSVPADDIKSRLLSDHQGLEHQLTLLGQAVAGDDAPAELCQAWTHFEASLRDHLDTEERYLFPLFATARREEVNALRREHQQIRNSLNELGVAAELHTLRKPAVDDLILFLRTHAAREDHSLYDWLEHTGDRTAERGLLAMFQRRLHSAERAFLR